jgi:hypothetical protein
MFTIGRHWYLSWATRIQSTNSHDISLRPFSILVLSSHLRPGLSGSLFFLFSAQSYTQLSQFFHARHDYSNKQILILNFIKNLHWAGINQPVKWLADGLASRYHVTAALGTTQQPAQCIKVKGKFVPIVFLTEHNAMNAYWGVEEYLHAFLTSAQLEVSGQLHSPAALPPELLPSSS